MARWAVVVPTNRPDRLRQFRAAWGPLFDQHHAQLIVVHDGPRRVGTGYCWEDFPDWVPRGSDMCRSYGFWRAWVEGAAYTVSLDDDVLPAADVDIFSEYEAVFDRGAPCSTYLNVGALTSYGGPMRGFPYKDRPRAEVAVQYGGFHGVLDYDACTQLASPQPPQQFSPVVVPVPVGAAVTGCAMNMAFRTEYTPVMWQLPLLEGRYNRYGDIWAGLLAKRVFDQVGCAVVVNGRACVDHDRASNPVANLKHESAGLELNERLWENLLILDGVSAVDCYRAVTGTAHWHFQRYDPEYADWFLDCRDKWLSLFSS